MNNKIVIKVNQHDKLKKKLKKVCSIVAKIIGYSFIVSLLVLNTLIGSSVSFDINKIVSNQELLSRTQYALSETILEQVTLIDELKKQNEDTSKKLIDSSIVNLQLEDKLINLEEQLEYLKDPNNSKLSQAYLKKVTVYMFSRGHDKAKKGYTGTGVVVKITDNYTYVLTNHHIVARFENISTSSFGVRSSGKFFVGQVVKQDSCLDLALIRIPGKIPSKEVIRGMAFPKAGEKIYTIGQHNGRPYIYGEGVYSGTQRENDVYQIPAMWGCSGSGLFNQQGKLVGLIYRISYADEGRERVWDITHTDAVKAINIQEFLKGIVLK